MLGFGTFASAQRFWRAFEEVRQYLRPRQKQNMFISLAQRRMQFVTRVATLQSMFKVA
jgi:putative transposase